MTATYQSGLVNIEWFKGRNTVFRSMTTRNDSVHEYIYLSIENYHSGHKMHTTLLRPKNQNVRARTK